MENYLSIAGSVLGGLGLFLLAVNMITEGLKLAAGEALTDILGRWTKTTGRGIFSGFTITSLVQSSSAITVATIGFVNAGLLSMPQALGVIYGANIGTTMTGWLVALVGFKIKIELFALPLIGVGMILKLVRPKHVLGSIGLALSGFGLFFVGIDILKSAFESAASQTDLQTLGGNGHWNLLLFLWMGFVITLLTQSSSAATALILTATTGGIIPFENAAAMVIGANIGTTSTAALSVIGATSNAKRVAVAHILFNLCTGLVALLILPAMLWLINYLGNTFKLSDAPAVTLALFHTAFNLLGVMLFWPATKILSRILLSRFQTLEEIESRPKYLDKNILVTPTLAINALQLELLRINEIIRRMAASAISTELAPSKQLTTDHDIATNLLDKVETYAGQLQRAQLTAKNVNDINLTYQASQYLFASAEVASRIATEQAVTRPVADLQLSGLLSEYQSELVSFIYSTGENVNTEQLAIIEAQYEKLKIKNDKLRREFRDAVTKSRISLQQLTRILEFLGRCRRLAKNSFRFCGTISQLEQIAAPEPALVENVPPAIATIGN